MYAATGAWASFVYLLGPSTPQLAEDFELDPRQAGLYGTALALGIVAGGSVSGPATARLGRLLSFRLGLLLLLCGVGTLVVSATYLVSLVAVWVGGVGGALVLNTSTATLSQIHPDDSAAAIAEANALAAWVGAASPLVLGAVLAAGIGWRGGVALCLALVGGALLASTLARGSTAAASPEPQRSVESAPGLLNSRFVATCVALFAATGAEFAVTFWGASLLRELTSPAGAAASMSAVVIGLAVGRTVGARLSMRLDTHWLLVGGFAAAALGFGTFWTGPVLTIAVLGLFLTGLGLSILFPFILDRVIDNSAGEPDRGLGVASLVLGSAIAIAPFLLGALASLIPVRTAFLLVPVLLGVGALAVLRSRPSSSTLTAIT